MLATCNRMTLFAGMFCIVALLVCTGIAQADCGMCGDTRGDRSRHHDFKKIETHLGLTDAQKVQVKAIFQGNRDVLKPVISELRAERAKLQSLIHADSVDEAAIRAETAKIAGIQADLNVARAKAGVQFRAILTPYQREILSTMHKKGQEKYCGPDAPAK